MAEVKKLAKYKVQDEKKDEDENYTVSVKVEPSDVFQTLQQSSAEVSKEKIAHGMKETSWRQRCSNRITEYRRSGLPARQVKNESGIIGKNRKKRNCVNWEWQNRRFIPKETV
mgnify:CR=1 FL=1